MFKFIKESNSSFFILLIIYIILGGYAVLSMEKGTFVLFINGLHSPFLDYFFKYITFLGDGIFHGIVIIALLFYRFYYALISFITLIASSIVVQGLKKTVFSDFPRPTSFFGDKYPLHFVEGVEVHCCQSFPSGHSATAFCIFLLFSLIFKNKILGILFFSLALFTTFSRSYLLQHFLIDTYFGAITGMLITLATFLYFENNPKLKNSTALQRKIKLG